MRAVSAKVCILGDFAVGKTSTVERVVNNQFSDKYLTTIGVKVDTKEIELMGELALKLVLWDVAGSDRFGPIEFNYLRGASGFVFAGDGTRPATLDTARDLKQQCDDKFGPIPSVLLVNKSDLVDDWEVSDEIIATLEQVFDGVYVTSAKTGDNVDDAITWLGRQVAQREFSVE
ncbi:MAG: Rab family GTPase [Pseudomonadota bacterium]